MVEHAENLDDLMMGEVSEGLSESDEKFSERLKVAQQKVAQVRKDEKKSKDFDHHLAKILRKLSSELLNIVILLIDEEVPSLTILAVLSLLNDDAGKVCWQEFEKYIAEKANFSNVNLPVEIEEKISYWWTFIFGADHVSKTVELKELRDNSHFIKAFTHSLMWMLQQYLKENSIEGFDVGKLKKILQKYETQLFQ